MTNIVRYGQGTSFQGPSEQIWGDLGLWEQKSREGRGTLIFDDFVKWDTSTTNGTSYQNGWTVVADDGPVLNLVAAPTKPTGGVGGEFGSLLLSGADADNDELYLTSSVTGTHVFIDDECKKIGFEIRMKKSAVTDAGLTFFAGLASVGAAVAGTLAADAGTLIATKGFIGFNQDDTDGNAVNPVVQAISQTQQTPQATAIPIVADTWIKLGFLYEPGNSRDSLRFFVNGAAQDITKFVFADLDDADFPNDTAMAPLVGFLHEGTANEGAEIDWIACGQYY